MISQISSNIHIYIYKSQIFPQAKTNPPAKLLMIAQLNEGAVFLPNLTRLPFFTSFWTSFFYLFVYWGQLECVVINIILCLSHNCHYRKVEELLQRMETLKGKQTSLPPKEELTVR